MKHGYKILPLIAPHCASIRFRGGHYVCVLPDGKGAITFSASPSDGNAPKQIFRDFRRKGILIEALRYV